jgi:transcriptional regulator with XRE-family HTH domain
MTMSSSWPGLIDAHVGRRLKARRRQLKLKQCDLARTLQVSIQQVHKYETAKSGLPAGRLPGLSRALGVSPGYFFDGIEADADDRPAARAAEPEPG